MPNPSQTQVYYSTDGTNYTEFPCPCTSVDESPGSTEDIDRSHLNPTNFLQTTSPGDRTLGSTTFHFEFNSRTDAHIDFLQLADATWWVTQVNPLYLRIAWPKASGDTTPPRSGWTAYLSQQPLPPNPESGRMMLDLTFKNTSDVTTTDGS